MTNLGFSFQSCCFAYHVGDVFLLQQTWHRWFGLINRIWSVWVSTMFSLVHNVHPEPKLRASNTEDRSWPSWATCWLRSAGFTLWPQQGHIKRKLGLVLKVQLLRQNFPVTALYLIKTDGKTCFDQTWSLLSSNSECIHIEKTFLSLWQLRFIYYLCCLFIINTQMFWCISSTAYFKNLVGLSRGIFQKSPFIYMIIDIYVLCRAGKKIGCLFGLIYLQSY